MEQIYTIPVNEAFRTCHDDPIGSCPICTLYRKLEDDELDRILGAAMMEPDVRLRTNAEGFCSHHFGQMLSRQNRLSLALMLESHLTEVEGMLSDGMLGAKGGKPIRRLTELEGSCYVCAHIEQSLSRMLETVVLLWERDSAFRGLLAEQKRFCLPHFRRLAAVGQNRLGKKSFPLYYQTLTNVLRDYLDKLRGDVSWFCKKFDYRYDAEPWYDAKDAIERAIGFLTASDAAAKEGRRR